MFYYVPTYCNMRLPCVRCGLLRFVLNFRCERCGDILYIIFLRPSNGGRASAEKMGCDRAVLASARRFENDCTYFIEFARRKWKTRNILRAYYSIWFLYEYLFYTIRNFFSYSRLSYVKREEDIIFLYFFFTYVSSNLNILIIGLPYLCAYCWILGLLKCARTFF